MGRGVGPRLGATADRGNWTEGMAVGAHRTFKDIMSFPGERNRPQGEVVPSSTPLPSNRLFLIQARIYTQVNVKLENKICGHASGAGVKSLQNV